MTPRPRLLAIAFAGLALTPIANATQTHSPDAAITQAAAAPYRDAQLKDARAFCSDLTRPPEILPSPAPEASCEQAVQSVFEATAIQNPPGELALSLRAHAHRLDVRGNHATGTFTLQETAPANGHRAVNIVPLGEFQLDLERVGGRWLVSSQARLAVIGYCQLRTGTDCRRRTVRLVFILGVPASSLSPDGISMPAAVRRASSSERLQFAAGRRVLIRSGCLACHQIGEEGNPGPGHNLTHIGSQLDSAEIEHALLWARRPMPSFANLPGKKLHDLVRFLSLLR